MYSRRNFLLSTSLAGVGFGIRSVSAQPEAQPELPIELRSQVQAVKEKILQIYTKQSEKFKESKGYTLDEATQFYLTSLKEIAVDLKAITGKDISVKINAQSAETCLLEINLDLQKLNLGLNYNLIRLTADLYAINIRFYQGKEIDTNQQQALFEKIGFKGYQKVPAYLVTNAFTPDVRNTDFFPAKRDPIIYGQIITEETGKVLKVLIFDQPIQNRARIERHQISELRDLIIVNELANVFFRQRVPVAKWTMKISDQLTMRHVAEAFSDYCSLHVCNQQLLIQEVSRIMSSSNPNYLLSKALTARALLPRMKEGNHKDSSEILEKLKNSNQAEFEVFKKSLLKSYSEYEAIQSLLAKE